MKKIFIASDHAGFEIKNGLVEHFSQLLEDLGTNSNDRVDYPDFAHSLVNNINNNPGDGGAGTASSLSGSSVTYAGGGGGGLCALP